VAGPTRSQSGALEFALQCLQALQLVLRGHDVRVILALAGNREGAA